MPPLLVVQRLPPLPAIPTVATVPAHSCSNMVEKAKRDDSCTATFKQHAAHTKASTTQVNHAQNDHGRNYDVCVVNRLCVHIFCREYLTLKSSTCSTRATGISSLDAGLAAGLVVTLLDVLARGLAAPLGGGRATGWAGDGALVTNILPFRNLASTVQLVGQTPYPTSTLSAHYLSGHSLSIPSSTPLGMPLSMDVRVITSESVSPPPDLGVEPPDASLSRLDLPQHSW